jgi:hypothetical protein
MKNYNFKINLSFSDKILKEGIEQELADVIARALEIHVDTCGIAPEDTEVFTTKIQVESLDKPSANSEIILFEEK